MKKFFTFVFASCLGFVIASLIVMGIMGVIFGSLASSAGNKQKSTVVKKNSILKLDFSSPIPEKTNNTTIDPLSFNFEQSKNVGLYDIVRSIEMAKEDDKIKGIYLDMTTVTLGSATASVVRDALIDFKESGKFIYSYADNYSQGAYYMASVADSIYVNPLGSVTFKGFAATIPFFKGLIDQLGIKMQVFYVGGFKSATEPYRYDKMSENSKLQIREYLEALYGIFKQDISDARNIPITKLQEIADGYLLRNAEDAIQFGFVDKKLYKDEIIDLLKQKLGLEEDDEIQTVDISKYSNKLKIDFKSKDKIAVIFAEGGIVDGEGETGNIGGKKYAKMIRKIRKDKDVKAIVLRVNSGGGSAFASEEIWRELEVAKSEGLPVIASMGDVAASGGYYIAAAADTILAEPNTITGSIGVFGMIPSAEKMLEEKLGVTFDTVKTARMAQGISPYMDIEKEEGQIIQESVDEIYEIFLKRVGDGRDMNRDEAHAVAQGRVWTGTKAKELGLVDVMGGLEDAILIAADKAGVAASYKVSQYPKTKEPLQELLDKFTGQTSVSTALTQDFVKQELGNEAYQIYKNFNELKGMKGVQAKMPYDIMIQQ